MLYTTVFALTAALSASAAPFVATSNLIGADTFSVKTVPRPNHVRNGAAALRKAYAKYGVAAPVLEKRQTTGTVPATPDGDDLEYLCPVSIGGQTLNLDFDTGSADLWVFSSLQPASQRSGHDYYTPSKSTTSAVKSGYSWSISYGDGSTARGSVYTDVVKIGAATVKNQAVEAAKSVSSSFVSSANDGLVGLAFSSINTVSPKSQLTFFDNIKSGLKSPLFVAALKHNAVGSYDFGYIDSTKYTGTLSYTPVDNSQGFWMVSMPNYKIGSTVYTYSGGSGIADTGTTLLLMADAVVTKYYAKVSGAAMDDTQGGYTFPCSSTTPSFSLKFGANYLTIPGNLMNYAPIDDTGVTCFGSLQSSSSIGFDIYGDIAFKVGYFVFDGGNTRLGVAPHS